MEILLIILLFVVIFPKIIFLVITPLLMIILLLLPTLIATKSIITLIQGPKSLLKLAFDKRARRNHALEHATINVLEEKYPEGRYAGYSTRTGFKIVGWLPSPDIVYNAAEEGLRRLQNGESKLAIHEKCGTSLMISNILFAALFLALLLGIGKFKFATWFVFVFLIFIISKPLGILAQKFLTTRADVKSIYIHNIEVEQPPANPVMMLMAPSTYNITTGSFKMVSK